MFILLIVLLYITMKLNSPELIQLLEEARQKGLTHLEFEGVEINLPNLTQAGVVE